MSMSVVSGNAKATNEQTMPRRPSIVLGSHEAEPFCKVSRSGAIMLPSLPKTDEMPTALVLCFLKTKNIYFN